MDQNFHSIFSLGKQVPIFYIEPQAPVSLTDYFPGQEKNNGSLLSHWVAPPFKKSASENNWRNVRLDFIYIYSPSHNHKIIFSSIPSIKLIDHS